MNPFKIGDTVIVKSESIHGWKQLISKAGEITAVQKGHDGTNLYRVELVGVVPDLTLSPAEFSGWYYEEHLYSV